MLMRLDKNHPLSIHCIIKFDGQVLDMCVQADSGKGWVDMLILPREQRITDEFISEEGRYFIVRRRGEVSIFVEQKAYEGLRSYIAETD